MRDVTDFEKIVIFIIVESAIGIFACCAVDVVIRILN